MKPVIWKPLALSVLLLSPVDVSAQMLSVPGSGGIGSVFGGGKPPPATLPMQATQLTELLAITKAALKNLEAMPGSQAAGVLGDVHALMAELNLMSGSFETIYDDPVMASTHAGNIAYKQRQIDRQVARLEEMSATAKAIEAKIGQTNAAAVELSRHNKTAPGALSALQTGNELQALQISQGEQEVLVGTKIWRAVEQPEARLAEEKAAAKVRECGFWGPMFTEACGE